MRAVAQAPSAQDLKLKVVVNSTPTPTDDEKTYSGPVFKRRQKTTTEPSEQTVSNGHALLSRLLYQAHPTL